MYQKIEQITDTHGEWVDGRPSRMFTYLKMYRTRDRSLISFYSFSWAYKMERIIVNTYNERVKVFYRKFLSAEM